jgi:ABC-type nitrate/sulfonate/bicarbonate transport system substrate-binding protein
LGERALAKEGTMIQLRCVLALLMVASANFIELSSSSAQTKITIGVAAMSPRTIPLLIAQEQGLFAKQGIDARVVLIKGAPTLVASLISGDIEVGYTGGTAVLGAASQGLYLRILSSVSSKLTHTIVANPSFKTAEQLRGKRFGIQSMGGTTWMHTILGLEHVGLDVKRDNISILIIGDSVLIGQSLEAGRIDAAVLDGALARRLIHKGFSVIVDLTPFNIPMVNQAVVVAPDFVQKRGELAERILMVLVDSLAFTLAPMNKSIVAKTIMRRLQIDDPKVGEEGYQDLMTSIERKPFPSLEGMRNIRRLMATQNPKAANVKIEDLIDTRIIRKLDENGYIDKVAAGYGLK